MSEADIDFLKDETPIEAATPEPVVETVEQPAAVSEPVVTTTPEPKEDRVPLAALMAMDLSKCVATRAIQELEARLRQFEQQQAQPSFYEAPEEYLGTVLQQHEERSQQRMWLALEEQAREVYPDYEEVFQSVLEAAHSNPMIAQQLRQTPNPAIAAYKLGKQLREMKAMQDPATYRAQIEAEVRAKVTAEMEAEKAARQKALDAIPPDLAVQRASKDNEVPPEDTLESILESRKRR